VVTKAELDRAMAEMQARFDSHQADTTAKLDNAKEEARIQVVKDHEMLVQTIIQQMERHREQQDLSLQQQLAALRLELANPHKPGTVSPSDGDRSQFIIQSTKRPPELGSGSRQQQEPDMPYRTDRYQPPRADCPGFNGENVIEWVKRCNLFFEMHQVTPTFKSKLSTNQYSGIASEWYDCYLLDHEPLDWPDLVRLVRMRFQLRGPKNGMELHQTTIVSEYIERFDRLRTHLLLKKQAVFRN
jgi:hypothetical protein